MTAVPSVRRGGLLRSETAAEDHRVTTFELFFDLVFVFAFTQVSQYMAGAHSALGVLQGVVVLGILWWSWVSYGWLGNQTFADEGIVRIGMSVALAAMFVVALVIPEAFDDLPGGLDGPVVLIVAYIVVRVVHLSLYIVAAGDDRELRRQVLVTSTAMLSGCAVLLVGAIVGGPAQTWLWLGGLVLDVVLTYVTSRRGSWRVQSASHWTERYGLIVILALGESIVAIGVGVARQPISTPILVGAVLAVLLSLALWWLYFDMLATGAEERMSALDARGRAALAIDGYTYLHFGLIAGVIIAALGVEEAMHVVEEPEPFSWFGAWALLGGVSLYLFSHALFWFRTAGIWKVHRLVGATVLLALLPAGASLAPLLVLGMVVLVMALLVGFEAWIYRERRAEIRALARR